MEDRTRQNLLENGKNYPMTMELAIVRLEYNGTVSELDSRTKSIKLLDLDLHFLGNVIERYSDFSDSVFQIISSEYWQELVDDIRDGDRQIDYDFSLGKYSWGYLDDDEILITAKVRNIGWNSDYDLLLEVKAKLPDTNILIEN